MRRGKSMEELDDAPRRFRERLDEQYGERLRDFYVFGSYARGKASAGSDLDVLVVLDRVESTSDELRRTSELRAELSLRFEMTVSSRWVSERDWEDSGTPFLERVREECVAA